MGSEEINYVIIPQLLTEFFDSELAKLRGQIVRTVDTLLSSLTASQSTRIFSSTVFRFSIVPVSIVFDISFPNTSNLPEILKGQKISF